MNAYPDSPFPVSDAIVAVHEAQFDHIVSSGTWGTGAERRAIAVEARRACYDAGVLEPPAVGAEVADTELPAVARHVARTVAASLPDLDQAFYGETMAAGLRDVDYVEIVGIVSRSIDLDVFARGIGAKLRPLPAPKSGAPTRQRPAEAVIEHAWVPTVPNGAAGGETGAELYHGQPMPYIVRSLSLVPDEMQAHISLEIAHYTRLDKLFDFSYQHHDGLTRPQVEVVAGRVSAINDCFY